MQNNQDSVPTSSKRIPWNKGKLIGAEPPVRPKHVSIWTWLMVEHRTRDLAMFKFTIDSKLRGCDVVALTIEDAECLRDRPRDSPPEEDRPPWSSLS